MAAQHHPVWRGLALTGLIALLETCNGITRELVLVPLLGGVTAKRVGFGIALLLIALVHGRLRRWLGAHTWQDQLAVGLVSVATMLSFEVAVASFGRGLHGAALSEALVADYDPRRGGLMGLGMLYLAVIPILVAWVAGEPSQARVEAKRA